MTTTATAPPETFTAAPPPLTRTDTCDAPFKGRGGEFIGSCTARAYVRVVFEVPCAMCDGKGHLPDPLKPEWVAECPGCDGFGATDFNALDVCAHHYGQYETTISAKATYVYDNRGELGGRYAYAGTPALADDVKGIFG